MKSDPMCSRLMFSKFVINGVYYCRPHLLIRCHFCEEDNAGMQDECNEERQKLGLRCGGDARLNQRAEKWGDRVLCGQLEAKMKVEQTQGQGIPLSLRMELKTREKAINEELLADVAEVFKKGASQCCYWACKNPDAEKLSKCAGCGVVRYCSKEHQQLDWKWEHKWECTKSVPKFLLDEIEADRQRNLRGDYEKIDRW